MVARNGVVGCPQFIHYVAYKQELVGATNVGLIAGMDHEVEGTGVDVLNYLLQGLCGLALAPGHVGVSNQGEGYDFIAIRGTGGFCRVDS